MVLPIYDIETKVDGGERYIKGVLRKKWLFFTPEEFVRQNLVMYLLEEVGVPKGLMSIERGLRVNQMQKRYDLVVYDREAKPMIALECKRPSVKIDQKAVQQLAVYNRKIDARYLLLTNGKVLWFFGKDTSGTFKMYPEVPKFDLL